MRVAESTVALSASHEAERSQSTEITIERGFRQIFESMASDEPESQNVQRERVMKLLQSLVDAIMAAMDGKTCKENLAAYDLPSGETPRLRGGREMSWQCKISELLPASHSPRPPLPAPRGWWLPPACQSSNGP